MNRVLGMLSVMIRTTSTLLSAFVLHQSMCNNNHVLLLHDLKAKVDPRAILIHHIRGTPDSSF